MEPYAAGLVHSKAFAKKRPVLGTFVAVSANRIAKRDLSLISPRTRCVSQFEVHELIVTEEDANPGEAVHDVAYWGFFETLRGGVIQVGDEVEVSQRRMASVIGFDVSHAPNHLNIVVRAAKQLTGDENQFQIGDGIVFRSPGDS
jgi:uncharacterized protein DUF6917